MADAGPADQARWVGSVLSRYEPALLLYAARLLGDADAARDVVQDTFERLCRQDRRTVEPKLAEWLYTVCRNRALDVKRRRRRTAALTDTQLGLRPSPDPGAPAHAEARDTAALVLRLLETLPDHQQEVIRLKFQHGMSYQQIARVTQLSASNVGFLISTGLKALRQRLRDRDAQLDRARQQRRQ